MISMELVNELWCPILRCDSCLERITNPEMAGIAWGEPIITDTTSPAAVMVLCKTNGCLGRGPGRPRLWMGLGQFLHHLTENAGMTPTQWTRARRLVRARSRI